MIDAISYQQTFFDPSSRDEDIIDACEIFIDKPYNIIVMTYGYNNNKCHIFECAEPRLENRIPGNNEITKCRHKQDVKIPISFANQCKKYIVDQKKQDELRETIKNDFSKFQI